MNTAVPNSEQHRLTPDATVPAPLEDAVVRRVFGISFTDVTREELLERLDRRIRSGEFGYIVTPNVDHVCQFQRNPAFRAAYAGACLVLCDGTPLLWALRILGQPIRQKLSGSDLLVWLTEFAADRGFSVFFFGAGEGIAAEAARRLTNRFPELRVAGVYAPPIGFHLDPASNAAAVALVRAANADIVYVALGSPKQEIWMAEHGHACGTKVMIGVGGSFDFIAGRIRRAPRWMQNAGLEWVWRLYQEPRRLWRRYLVDDMVFFKLVLAEALRGRRGEHSRTEVG